MSDLVGNHIVGFLTRRLICICIFTLTLLMAASLEEFSGA